MIRILKIIILAAALVLIWQNAGEIQKFFQKSDVINSISNSQLAAQIQNIEKQIFAPPPLKGSLDNKTSQLTVSGVIKWTNINRAQNGSLPALKENYKLDKAAQAKVADMFK